MRKTSSARKKAPLIQSVTLHVALGVMVLIIIFLKDSQVVRDIPIEIQLSDVHVHRKESPTEAPRKRRPPVPRPTKTLDANPHGKKTQSEPALGWEQLSEGQRNEYLAALILLISKHKYYPRASILNEEEGVVQLKVILGADGKLIDSEVSKTSGYARLDEAALKTVRDIAVFPIPAKNTKGIHLLIPIRYELNPNH